MTWKKIGIAALLTALAATGAQAQQSIEPWLGPGYWGGPWHGWFMGPLMMLVFLTIVVAVLVLIVRWLAKSNPAREAPGQDMPLRILEQRFARGEIDKAEFEERRKILQK